MVSTENMRTCVSVHTCVQRSRITVSLQLLFILFSQSPFILTVSHPFILTFTHPFILSVSHSMAHRCLSPFHPFFISVHTSMRYQYCSPSSCPVLSFYSLLSSLFLSSIHYCSLSFCLVVFQGEDPTSLPETEKLPADGSGALSGYHTGNISC